MVIQTHPLQATNFLKFVDVVAKTSCKIAHDWVIDLVDGIKHLAFWIME
jgi:hypothetical protein